MKPFVAMNSKGKPTTGVADEAEALHAAVVAGDPGAFAQFYQAHANDVARVVYRLVGDVDLDDMSWRNAPSGSSAASGTARRAGGCVPTSPSNPTDRPAGWSSARARTCQPATPSRRGS